MSIDAATVSAKIEKAKSELAAAESELDLAISDMAERDRADKEIIAPKLEAAFARLRSARTALTELDELVNAG